MTAAFVILLACGLVLAAQAVVLGRRWAAGREAGVDLAAGLRRLPRAYLGTLHDAMSREPRIAHMHALVAGGTLAAMAATALQALTGWAVFALLAGLAALFGLGGALIDAHRRRARRPARLSGGAFDRLPYALLALDLGLLLSAASPWLGRPAGLPGALLVALGGGWLALRSGRGPMRHALAGIVSLVAHPRPERFTPGTPATALRPTEGHGIGEAAGFSWNRLAMFDACVQCGKCEAACPAYAAGQPLNPKALLADLVQGRPGIPTEDYAGHGHPAAVEHRPFDHLIPGFGPGPVAPETLWSCTTCRACVEACPMLIEHVDAIVDLRRHETLARGIPPRSIAATLLDLRETDTLSGRALAERYDWATDLGLRTLRDGEGCEVLLWAGESAYDLRSQSTLRALVRLLKRAGVDVATLGTEERDCGDLARRVGDEPTFLALACANLAALSTRRVGRIVSADPHAVHCLSREYPALGHVPPVQHHATYLLELLSTGRLEAPALEGRTVTYHDPCYLGRYLGETESPRRILDHLGLTQVEMADHGRSSRCCGGGGGAPLADIAGRRRVPDIRMDQARATGAETIVAACPYCTQMFEGVTGPRPEVRDLAELVWLAVEGAS